MIKKKIISTKYEKKIIIILKELLKEKKYKKIHFEYYMEYNLFGLINLGMRIKINEKNYILRIKQNSRKNLDDLLECEFYNSILINLGFEILDFDVKDFTSKEVNYENINEKLCFILNNQ